MPTAKSAAVTDPVIATVMQTHSSRRIRRMQPKPPAPVSDSLILTGEKLNQRRTALGLSRAQLSALALVGEQTIRYAELDAKTLTLAEMIRLEYVLRSIESAAAEARAAAGIAPLILPDKLG